MQAALVAYDEQPVSERANSIAARKALGIVTESFDAGAPQDVAALFGSRDINALVAQHHAVNFRRGGFRHEPAPHVSQHCLWIALERIAETAAALPAHCEHIAALH